jgi:hypothetical protein
LTSKDALDDAFGTPSISDCASRVNAKRWVFDSLDQQLADESTCHKSTTQCKCPELTLYGAPRAWSRVSRRSLKKDVPTGVKPIYKKADSKDSQMTEPRRPAAASALHLLLRISAPEMGFAELKAACNG